MCPVARGGVKDTALNEKTWPGISDRVNIMLGPERIVPLIVNVPPPIGVHVASTELPEILPRIVPDS